MVSVQRIWKFQHISEPSTLISKHDLRKSWQTLGPNSSFTMNLIPSPGDDNGISLKIEPQRTVENLDHKVLLPMKIRYNKKAKDSVIQVSAQPTGNEGLSTYESFRGQFFSTVVDEKNDQTPTSIPHLIEQKNPTKKMYVERRTWEEGITPLYRLSLIN